METFPPNVQRGVAGTAKRGPAMEILTSFWKEGLEGNLYKYKSSDSPLS